MDEHQRLNKNSRRRILAISQLAAKENYLVCDSFTRSLVDCCRIAQTNEALLEVANKDHVLICLFNETYEAHGYAAVRQSLMNSLVLQTIRCWDNPLEHRASLPALAERLRGPGVIQHIQQVSSDWATRTPEGQELCEAISTRMPQLLSKIEHLRIDAVGRLKRVRGYRDVFLAHNLINLPDQMPKYDDLFGLLRETLPLVAEASLLVRGHVLDTAAYARQVADEAKAFWNVVRQGQQHSRSNARGGVDG